MLVREIPASEAELVKGFDLQRRTWWLVAVSSKVALKWAETLIAGPDQEVAHSA